MLPKNGNVMVPLVETRSSLLKSFSPTTSIVMMSSGAILWSPSAASSVLAFSSVLPSRATNSAKMATSRGSQNDLLFFISVSHRNSNSNSIHVIVNDCAVAADILLEFVSDARREPKLDVVNQREVGPVRLVIAAAERSEVFILVVLEVPAQSGHQFPVRGEHSIQSGGDNIARKRLACGLNRHRTASGVTQHSGRFVVDSSRQRGLHHRRSFVR